MRTDREDWGVTKDKFSEKSLEIPSMILSRLRGLIICEVVEPFRSWSFCKEKAKLLGEKCCEKFRDEKFKISYFFSLAARKQNILRALPFKANSAAK